MPDPNPFQKAAVDMKRSCHHRGQPPKGRYVDSLDGIDAKPLSWFSSEGRVLMLDLIAAGEAEFFIHEDKLLIPRSAVEPYLAPGCEWDE